MIEGGPVEQISEAGEEGLEDLSDEEQVRARKRESKSEELQRREMLSAVVSLPQGLKLLREIIFDWCHINRPSMALEPLVMAHSEGERNIGLRLLADLAPADFLKLLNEEKENG